MRMKEVNENEGEKIIIKEVNENEGE